jgi:hypothetical protein
MDNVIHYWDYCNIFPLTKKSPNEGKDAGAKEPCGSGRCYTCLKLVQTGCLLSLAVRIKRAPVLTAASTILYAR